MASAFEHQATGGGDVVRHMNGVAKFVLQCCHSPLRDHDVGDAGLAECLQALKDRTSDGAKANQCHVLSCAWHRSVFFQDGASELDRKRTPTVHINLDHHGAGRCKGLLQNGLRL